MFSLNGAVKYKYIPNYQDMRGGLAVSRVPELQRPSLLS